MTLFGNRLKNVNAKIWEATRPDFAYPELSDPELKASDSLDKPNLGLAFSGGGTRSATATLGQLRGLAEIGILEKARYLSCVSGGSFTSTAFTYLPNNHKDRAFFGPVINPQAVTADQLLKTTTGSFTHALTNSFIVDDYLKNALRLAGDETYPRAIGDIFLLPFGLDSLKRFFSLDRNSVAAILKHNANMLESDFYRVREGRPFLIINAIILRPDNEKPLAKMIPVETTPLYTGTRTLFRDAGSNGRDIGGGFLEPFAFDSDAPEKAPDRSGRVKVRLGVSRHRYTLSDAIGTSGAAPAKAIAEAGLAFLGFPEFKHWPLTGVGQTAAKEYEYGDGGNLENLGLIPLLARKVERIIVFVNTRHPLIGSGPGEINGAIPPLFGQTTEFQTNVVLQRDKYLPLVEGLLTAKAEGRSVIFKDSYQVQDNAFHGITGGWQVEILWVYNERVPAWEQRLPLDIRQSIGQESLANFPHYETYGQNRPSLIDLRPEQVFLLANLSTWNILENDELFISMLS